MRLHVSFDVKHVNGATTSAVKEVEVIEAEMLMLVHAYLTIKRITNMFLGGLKFN